MFAQCKTYHFNGRTCKTTKTIQVLSHLVLRHDTRKKKWKDTNCYTNKIIPAST